MLGGTVVDWNENWGSSGHTAALTLCDPGTGWEGTPDLAALL